MSHSRKPSAGGKSVLITGCSSGIGKATAITLANRGFTVFATVRKESDSQNLKDLGQPHLIPVHPLDLSHPEDIARVLEIVGNELKRKNIRGLYGLVNNAGGGSPSPVELMDTEKFRAELDARVVGSVAMVQDFLPLLREASGRIIWIMTPAIIPTPYVSVIHSCDFAINCIARTLDIELKQQRIHSIMIRCGGIKTPAGMRTAKDVEAILKTGPADRTSLYESSLLRWCEEMAQFDNRRTDVDKVARLVLKALLSETPRSRYSTGYMSKAAALLELLPQRLTDRILKSMF